MKLKKILSTIAMTLLLSIATGCSDQIISDSHFTVERRNEIKKQADEILETMSIEEKVGQMLCIGVRGTEVDDEVKKFHEKYKPGSIILLEKNFKSEEQVKKFTSDLQKTSKLPLFIAIDEEGGSYVRAPEIIAPPPSQMDIAQTGDPNQARDWAIKTSKRLKELGINLNFAPILDVGYSQIDGRSYSDDPKIVANFAKSAINGYQSENFPCTVKHFPGLGHSVGDVNTGLSTINVPKKILESTDLVPFKEILDIEPEETVLVMMSPAKYTSLDENNTANMSDKIITDLLRNEMEYNGVIITGDFEMGAISNTLTLSDVSVQAVQAGVDIIFITKSYEYAQDIYDGILNAVKSGKLSEERINESVKRILRSKIYANLIQNKE